MKRLMAASLLALCATTHASIINGNTLHKHLSEASSSNVSWGFAHGYVSGVNDTNNGVSFCTPESVTIGQMTDMVKLFMDNTPSVRHLPADAIITYVFQKAWPCPKKGNAL